MRALVATDYGALDQALVLASVPEPVPAPGQVLVRVRAAALNPLDLALILGSMREQMPIAHPFTVGMDAAGVVVAVGDGVRDHAPGDEVLGYSAFVSGTVAEYTLIESGPYLASRPAGLDPVRAAGVPESGLTATHLLRAAGLRPGSSMLVIGATGGIGLYTVQLATAAGVEVLATGKPTDRDYVRSLGAVEMVDYTRGQVVRDALALRPDGVDVVLDLVNAGPDIVASAEAVRPGGRVVSPLGGPTELGRGVTAHYIGQMTPRPGDLAELAARAASGRLRVEVGAVYPLDEAKQAVTDFASRHIHGKVVVRI
ncbi:NADP-dependent oxidoreductase [Actinoalloteichus sp. AHMU CJ021]|uniref:NADPH:quinone reductase n=2 Tax=Actinoalloteichus cyanogriseus TaxID=2893586 RepID=A0ABT1JK09_ACTCY|nr:NADP-dependent oxidoreductase [Actinoalloteichus caeruleus]AUS78408.1 NADP-dependent oxidoreductase [Actinoalloteichus sp. AHMU CJ021]MCP2332491.1 NADPH:quinone reductase [Actinoalloteichus caeruleus DSM 43889]